MVKKKFSKSRWKTTDNRFVAFIDILGFKELIQRNSHEEIYKMLDKISETQYVLKKYQGDMQAKGEHLKNGEVYIVNFSDSIVIFSKNDDIENLKFFLLAVTYLFFSTICAGIPLKGGIAHGNISLNKKEQIYFGQPIVDAYSIEEDVNFMGIVAHNSIDKYLKANPYENDQGYFIEHKVFLKSGKLNHLTINWIMGLIYSQNYKDKDFTENVNSVINEIKINASGAARKYIDNTLEFIDELVNSKKITPQKITAHNTR